MVSIMSAAGVNAEEMLNPNIVFYHFDQIRPEDLVMPQGDNLGKYSDNEYSSPWFKPNDSIEPRSPLTGQNQFNDIDPTMYGMALEDLMNFAGVSL